jgi:hypothetical protein
MGTSGEELAVDRPPQTRAAVDEPGAPSDAVVEGAVGRVHVERQRCGFAVREQVQLVLRFVLARSSRTGGSHHERGTCAGPDSYGASLVRNGHLEVDPTARGHEHGRVLDSGRVVKVGPVDRNHRVRSSGDPGAHRPVVGVHHPYADRGAGGHLLP